MNFRKDINGLRAIAVIAVVLFHFQESWVPGGFAGVDIFFVISGFLMTGIVFRGMEEQRFSLAQFYIARANRIIPALAVLCLCIAVLGWSFMPPVDYKELGLHISSSIGFFSNFIYWKESGYFDAASHEKWLLHTWSLSVEWQFYILYPLVLVILRRFISLQLMKKCLIVATIIAFICSVIATFRFQSGAYFLLPSRAWAMMLGGVAFLYPLSLTGQHKKWCEGLGAVFILGSFIFISKYDAWPGYLSLFPVFGTFLMIQAQRNDSFITSNRVFQSIGSWSYSIYLWHWPIAVVIVYFELTFIYIIPGILLSLVLGFLSYRYIEKCSFNRDFPSVQAIVCHPPFWLAGLVMLIGVALFYSDGALFRYSAKEQLIHKSAIESIGDWHFPKANYFNHGKSMQFIQGRSDKNILLIGSSHIEQIYPYAEHIQSEYNIFFLTKGGCFLAPSYVNPKWDCSKLQDYEELIKNIKFDKIVTSLYNIDGYLSEDAHVQKKQIEMRVKEYDEFLRFVKQYVNEVYLLLPEPKGIEFHPKYSVRHTLRHAIGIDEMKILYSLHYAAFDQLQALDGVQVINPLDFLCTQFCPVMDDNFNFYYRDDNHMRPEYAIQALDYLAPIFKESLVTQ